LKLVYKALERNTALKHIPSILKIIDVTRFESNLDNINHE